MQSFLTAAAALAVAVAVVAPAAADAATIEVTSGTGQRSFRPSVAGGTFGQSFTSIDTTLTSIGFQFNALNPTFTGAAYTLSLFAGETLTGNSLVTRTFTLPTAINSRTPVWYDIDIGTTDVTVGQRYTAVLSSTDTRNGVILGPNINLNTGVELTGDAYAGGRALFTTVPYPNCTNATTSNCDLNFRVVGTTAAAAVPEPATWAMMLGGFALLGGALRRRRPAAFAA